MVIAIDTSNHWQYITGRETVTYYSRTDDAFPAAGQSVPNAKRLPLAKELVLADAQLAKAGLKWVLWRNQLAGVIPAPGDKLIDQFNATWLVQRVDVESLQQRFDLTCIRSNKD